MTTETFLATFGHLADAPGGIERLREIILQLAVRGKLVEQDPDDEPAEVLLEQIKEERKALLKQKTFRRIRIATTRPGDHLYTIPSHWRWVRIPEVAHDWGQKTPDEHFSYIDVSAIDNHRGLIDMANVEVLSPKDAPSRARKLVANGSVIYSTVRPYLLNVAVVEQDVSPEPIVSTAFEVLHPFTGVSSRFLFYYLRSKPFIEYVEKQMKGVAYPAINKTKMMKGLVPLPPFPEQKRIVARVDELMALCDELETHKVAKYELHNQLHTSTLYHLTTAEDADDFATHWTRVQANFDLLFDTPEAVDTLRQSILELAVRGKLVPQNPDDEPAEVFLQRIVEEKKRLYEAGEIRKPKKVKPVTLEQQIYKLPAGWVWTRFNGVATIASNLVEPTDFLDFPHIGPGNIETGRGKLIEFKTVGEDDVISKKHHFFPGQILYSKIRPNLAKNIIAPFEGLCSADMYPLDVHIHTGFLQGYLLSNVFLAMVVDDDNRLAMPKVNQTQLRKVLVPVPPLPEQKRIVAKVDELTVLCDELEDLIRRRDAKVKCFAESVVHAAGEPEFGMPDIFKGADVVDLEYARELRQARAEGCLTPDGDDEEEVPYASDVGVLLDVMERVRMKQAPAQIASERSQSVRTVHRYLALGRWLGWLESSDSAHDLTPTGHLYLDDATQRATLFRKAVKAQTIVRAALAKARHAEISLYSAVKDLLIRHGGLNETSADRRATDLHKLIQEHLQGDLEDWMFVMPGSANEREDLAFGE